MKDGRRVFSLLEQRLSAALALFQQHIKHAKREVMLSPFMQNITATVTAEMSSECPYIIAIAIKSLVATIATLQHVCLLNATYLILIFVVVAVEQTTVAI